MRKLGFQIKRKWFISIKTKRTEDTCPCLLDPFALVAILIIVGLGAGTLGSMTGVGGGVVMTPALTLMGFAPPQISSTSLFAVTFTSASSTISYAKQKKIHYRVGLKTAVASIPGAIVGAFISNLISIDSFKIYFGILLMLAGLYIAYISSLTKERQERPAVMRRSLNSSVHCFILGHSVQE